MLHVFIHLSMNAVEFLKYLFHLSALADGSLRADCDLLIMLRILIILAVSVIVIQLVNRLVGHITQQVQMFEVHIRPDSGA